MNDIGYKKPPKHSRFKKGQSGNPAGRPKGKSSFKTLKEMIADELLQEITMQVNGRKKKVLLIQAVVRAMASAALKGNSGAFKQLLSMADKHLPTQHSIADLMGGRAVFELTPEDMKELTEARLLDGASEHVTVVDDSEDEVLEPGDDKPGGTPGESKK
jgi:hypothetical protein